MDEPVELALLESYLNLNDVEAVLVCARVLLQRSGRGATLPAFIELFRQGRVPLQVLLDCDPGQAGAVAPLVAGHAEELFEDEVVNLVGSTAESQGVGGDDNHRLALR
jgi:hypothetical protein